MRWMVFAGCAAITAALCLPGASAEPQAAARGSEAITFEQYRDWRNTFTDRRRSELAVELSAPDLPEARKTRLQQTQAYYDWLAGLSDTERDRRFRERFDRIDANRDGVIDPDERAAWRDKRRAFYNRSGAARPPHSAAEAR
jgi:hypothetical protein